MRAKAARIGDGRERHHRARRARSQEFGASNIDGPLSGRHGLFVRSNWETYDAVIAMYHDQALIPIKTDRLRRGGAIVTLGLPIVRTSPDHGTAFDHRRYAALAPRPRHARRVAPRGPADGVSQIDDLPPLREVIARHGLSAKKQLGQNFLLDLNLTPRIARTAGPLEDVTVIEVGPGPGGLTRALLAEGARKVIAIERDERALPALAEIAAAYPGRLEVISGDALTIRLCARWPTARRASSRTCPTISAPSC